MNADLDSWSATRYDRSQYFGLPVPQLEADPERREGQMMWVERDIVGLRKTDRLTHISSVTYLQQCGDELLLYRCHVDTLLRSEPKDQQIY